MKYHIITWTTCLMLLFSASRSFMMQKRIRIASAGARATMRIAMRGDDVVDNTPNNPSSKASVALAATCLSLALSCFSIPASSFGAVGEGGLPDGAMAFSKILKYQKDWNNLAATVKSRSAEMSQQEVLGMKAFLKQLANEYRDMQLLGTGITDKDKQQQSMEVAKEFRKIIRECDDAASDNNFNKIMELYPRSAELLDSFLALLQDVPDEL